MAIANEYRQVLVENRSGSLIISINRPAALNALNNEVFQDLQELFSADIDATEIKGVVITGVGSKAFAAGADIKEFVGLDRERAEGLSRRGQAVFKMIERFPRVVVAAVNGFALGGGCELSMACHLRVVGEHAKFGQPEVNLGILPGYGATQRLPMLIGRSKALEMLLTGDMISAEEALRHGLANRLCTSGEEINEALKIIDKISTRSPLAVRETIAAVNDFYDHTIDGYTSEQVFFGKLAATDDFNEGVNAFIEKRKPNWKGV